MPAPSVQYIDLTAEGAYHNESASGANIVNNPDGSITVTFSQQYAALNFFLPDNAQNYYSNYKSIVITYTSEGGDLGHALYDTHMVGPANTNAGKHPDWSKQIKESKEENTLILKVSNECEGGCIRGFQIFNPNLLEEGNTITITIKSIIFSDKENPSEEDLKPIVTPGPTEPGSSLSPSASPTSPGGSSAAPSQTPNKPGVTAAPAFHFELTKEGAIHNESKSGATITNNPDGSVTVTSCNSLQRLISFCRILQKGIISQLS